MGWEGDREMVESCRSKWGRLTMHDQSSAAELFDRIKKKAPAYLDLLTAESDEEFEEAFTAILERAVHHLEKTRKTSKVLTRKAFRVP
jgi:hypothetical protein